MDLRPFIEIEKKYNLLDANVEGYHFWIYLRAELIGAFQECHDVSAYRSNSWNNKWRMIREKVIDVLTNGRVPKVKEGGVLILNHPRRVMVDGLYDCIYTDDISQMLEKTVTLEESYQGMHYKPIRTKNIVYTDITEFYSYCYCVMRKFIFSKKYDEVKGMMLQVIREPVEELNKVYETEVLPEQFENQFIFGLCIYKVEKAYFKRIISKVKPKLIMEVVSYNRKCMVINEVASEMNIPTIELQHGTIGEEHIAYNYPQDTFIKQFPQYIFLFSDYWRDKAAFPIKIENRIAVGYPYLEKMAHKYLNRKKDNNKKNILILSSGPIGDKLAAIAALLVRILDMGKYHIIFKLHPKEYSGWKERYPVLLNTNVEIVDNNQVNLYELYTISDVQVSGYNSTTVFEGLYFGLPTYILDYCVSVEIANLCLSGFANYFKTAEELATLIQQNEGKTVVEDLQLWKSNGLQNILKEIDGILAKGM